LRLLPDEAQMRQAVTNRLPDWALPPEAQPLFHVYCLIFPMTRGADPKHREMLLMVETKSRIVPLLCDVKRTWWQFGKVVDTMWMVDGDWFVAG
jgi:hypothetical protein